MSAPDSRPAPLPGGVTLIDLRPPALRRPLLNELTTHAVRVVSLDDIETGAHGLTRDTGPLLVVCERGVRSTLAARYLRADGLDAAAYPGGVPALQEALRGA
ncbi:rhodanese-like domain-containing protein [Deinococcus sp.]|uniref:rhodanese-like domain-containing protein n=1 Tax=Deinococcus sp. TaxID=47478 RepID=UPI0025C54F4F|nr:rhodanese-like domain-containing protein [Deinococcus sp.]